MVIGVISIAPPSISIFLSFFLLFQSIFLPLFFSYDVSLYVSRLWLEWSPSPLLLYLSFSLSSFYSNHYSFLSFYLIMCLYVYSDYDWSNLHRPSFCIYLCLFFPLFSLSFIQIVIGVITIGVNLSFILLSSDQIGYCNIPLGNVLVTNTIQEQL